MKTTPLSSIQAGLVSLLTDAVGLVVALVPSLAADERILIAAGTQVIVFGFLVANAIHAHAVAVVKAAKPEVIPVPAPAAPAAQATQPQRSIYHGPA